MLLKFFFSKMTDLAVSHRNRHLVTNKQLTTRYKAAVSTQSKGTVTSVKTKAENTERQSQTEAAVKHTRNEDRSPCRLQECCQGWVIF